MLLFFAVYSAEFHVVTELGGDIFPSRSGERKKIKMGQRTANFERSTKGNPRAWCNLRVSSKGAGS